jgi:hypothetical protein
VKNGAYRRRSNNYINNNQRDQNIIDATNLLHTTSIKHTTMTSLDQFISAAAHPSNAALALIGTNESDDDDLMPWERDGWRPLEKSGQQKTPNKIRGELQRYIDACKAGKSAIVLCLSCCLLRLARSSLIFYMLTYIRWLDDADCHHPKDGSQQQLVSQVHGSKELQKSMECH